MTMAYLCAQLYFQVIQGEGESLIYRPAPALTLFSLCLMTSIFLNTPAAASQESEQKRAARSQTHILF